MNITKHFQQRHPDLFRFLPAKEVHPHDHFMARLILWLFPRTITPNQVTLFRIAMTPAVFLFFLMEQYLIGTVLFLIVAFTDAIDGSLARTRNQITAFGILMDPLADKFLIGSTVLVLVLRYFSTWLVIIILGLEILFIASALVAKYSFKTVRMANIWGKIKMLLQVFAIFVTLLALLLDYPYLLTVAWWLFGLAIGFAIVSLFAHGT